MLFRKMAATELDWVMMIASLLVTEHVPGTSSGAVGQARGLGWHGTGTWVCSRKIRRRMCGTQHRNVRSLTYEHGTVYTFALM
jgi:hypothetical protein